MFLPLNLRRSIEQLIRNTFKPYQDEILINADCEDGLPILNTTGVQNNCLAVLTTDRAFSGSKSVKLSAGPAAATTDRFLGLGVGGVLNGLKQGETYELSCWAYVPSGQSITLTNVYLRAYDYQGSFTTTDSNSPTSTDRREKLSVRFTARAAATQLFFRCYLAEASNDGRYILLDHFRLRVGPRVSTATPQALSLGNTAAAGTSPRPSPDDHIHALPASTSVMTKIGEVTADGSSGVITFNSIPGGYRHLYLAIAGQSDNASDYQPVRLTFNTSGAAIYDGEALYNSAAATPAAVEQLAQTYLIIGNVPGSNAPAGAPGVIEVTALLYGYTTWQKAVLFKGYLGWGTVTGKFQAYYGGGLWRSTSAISRIDLTLGAGNWLVDSVVALYGIPA